MAGEDSMVHVCLMRRISNEPRLYVKGVFLILCVWAFAACTGDNSPTFSSSKNSPPKSNNSTGAVTSNNVSSSRIHKDADGFYSDEYDCERDQGPCMFADIPDEALARTSELVEQAQQMLRDGATLLEVAEWLAEQEGVAGIYAREHYLEFWVEGGYPFSIFNSPRETGDEDLDSTQSRLTIQDDESSQSEALRKLLQPLFEPGERSEIGKPLASDVLCQPKEKPKKKALLLSPWRVHWPNNDGAVVVKEILESLPEYEVRYLEGAEVGREAFEVWDEYDFIFVMTHGGGFGMRYGLLSGKNLKSLEECREYFRAITPQSNRIGLSCSSTASEDNYFMTVGAKFFAHHYDSALSNKVIMLGSCSPMADEDMAKSLVEKGSNSVVFGYREVIYPYLVVDAWKSLTTLLTVGYDTTEAHREVCGDDMSTCSNSRFSVDEFKRTFEDACRETSPRFLDKRVQLDECKDESPSSCASCCLKAWPSGVMGAEYNTWTKTSSCISGLVERNDCATCCQELDTGDYGGGVFMDTAGCMCLGKRYEPAYKLMAYGAGGKNPSIHIRNLISLHEQGASLRLDDTTKLLMPRFGEDDFIEPLISGVVADGEVDRLKVRLMTVPIPESELKQIELKVAADGKTLAGTHTLDKGRRYFGTEHGFLRHELDFSLDKDLFEFGNPLNIKAWLEFPGGQTSCLALDLQREQMRYTTVVLRAREEGPLGNSCHTVQESAFVTCSYLSGCEVDTLGIRSALPTSSNSIVEVRVDGVPADAEALKQPSMSSEQVDVCFDGDFEGEKCDALWGDFLVFEEELRVTYAFPFAPGDVLEIRRIGEEARMSNCKTSGTFDVLLEAEDGSMVFQLNDPGQGYPHGNILLHADIF